ncbi:hypothetical protein Hanom_Chr02g00148091 [Helianthus anomalus]
MYAMFIFLQKNPSLTFEESIIIMFICKIVRVIVVFVSCKMSLKVIYACILFYKGCL